MTNCLAAALLLLGCASLPARAQVASGQDGKPTVPGQPQKAPQPRADVKVPLLDKPISLADFPNMEPRVGLKDKLGHLTNFIQNQPTDGAAATQATEAYIGRTSQALYIVFLCFDNHPELIRTHLARRENILKDDYMSVILDPFQDRQRGVLFQVNPTGVQADASWTEVNNNGPDYSFDQVWDSEGRITKRGWMAIMVLPFRSLRFPPRGGDWGVVIWRNLPRNSENDWWPRVSAAVSGALSQEGILHMDNLAGVTGSHNVQINPYVLGQNEHTLNSLDPNNPAFSSRSFEGTGGGEAKAVWKDSIVFDGTINPDFSDVESDQPQFTVDQRYPVYFPELRPFFLENASYFATPLTLLYTRNIIRPDYGIRVTGKVGHTNLGILAIDDREPGETVAPGDPLYGQKAKFYVGRVDQDLGTGPHKGSNIGLMYTDEEFGGGFNRIGGADFTWRLDKNWTMLGQMVESATAPSRPDSAAEIFPTGYQAGPAADWQLQRNGHSFNMFDEYQDVSSGFDSLLGFYQTANIRSDHIHATYQWFPKHSEIQSYGVETNQNVAFDHAGNRVYHYSTFDPFVLLPRNIVVAPIGGQNCDTVGPQDSYPLTGNVNFTENFGGIVARGQPWSQFNFNLTALKSGNVNYYPVTGASPFLMNQETVSLLFSVNPIKRLTDDNTYLLDRDHDAHTGALVYEVATYRTKLNYQFTRAWSARVIAEYDTTLANAALTSLARTKEVQTQALVTWLPHPGTVLYIGWNNDIQNYAHTLCSKSGGICDPTMPILPRSNDYLNDGRQFFVKASYLFRW